MYIKLDKNDKIVCISDTVQEGFIKTDKVSIADIDSTYSIDSTTKQVTIIPRPKKLSKDMLISTLKVTTKSGKIFYADTGSRLDISTAIEMSNHSNVTTTLWKLAEPINGKKIVNVTIEELKEAQRLALMAKGSLIGVT